MKNLFLFTIVSIFTASLTQAQTFTLKSNDLGGQGINKQVFNSFGCTGENMSPQLYWEHTPAGTKSFGITIFDPDAPTGSGWWHWLIFDIPSSVTELKTDAGNISKQIAPKEAIQSMTDFGKNGYGGPCPPEGDRPHQYIVTVYALKIDKLSLDKNASPAMVSFYLNNNMIAKSSMIFYYKR